MPRPRRPDTAPRLVLTVMLAACSDGASLVAPRAPSPSTGVAARSAAPYTFHLLDACAGCVTGANGISNNGLVGAGANGQGYVYDSKLGTWTSVPGTFVMTVPANNGEAPGLTIGNFGAPAPVIRDRDGTVRQVPGFPGSRITAIIQLDDNGSGVGWTSADVVHWFSFVRTRDGTYTSLSYPGPVGPLTLGTFLLGRNASGTMVGYLADPTETQTAGVIRDKDGTWREFMIPGSSGTMIYAINETGTLAGTYRDADGRWHGFVWTRGAVQTVDAPGASNTVASGINNRGELVIDTFTGASPLTGVGGSSYLVTR